MKQSYQFWWKYLSTNVWLTDMKRAKWSFHEAKEGIIMRQSLAQKKTNYPFLRGGGGLTISIAPLPTSLSFMEHQIYINSIN